MTCSAAGGCAASTYLLQHLQHHATTLVLIFAINCGVYIAAAAAVLIRATRGAAAVGTFCFLRKPGWSRLSASEMLIHIDRASFGEQYGKLQLRLYDAQGLAFAATSA